MILNGREVNMTKTSLASKKCVYVTKAEPSRNYCDKTSVFTGRFKNSNDIYRFYIKFNLDEIEERVKSTMYVESAFLCLQLTRNEVPEVPGTASLYLYRLLESFEENKINWSNQPLASSEVDAITAIASAKTGKIQIDITNLVKGWIDSSIPDYGVLIKGEENINSLLGFTGNAIFEKSVPPSLVIEFKYKKSNPSENGRAFDEFYTVKSEYFQAYLESERYDETEKLAEIVSKSAYKGIVVYPAAINWEPIQRPQQLLIELASKGYLCFFCCPPTADFFVQEVKDNLFVLNNEDYLLPYLKNKFVIVLCTWLIQLTWADFIPNKLIWYDILDRFDFLSCFDEDMLRKHNEIVEDAEIITYSAKPLEEFTHNRTDAIYLPNAANPNDFSSISKSLIPPQMEEIISLAKPIIGYFGAIEEWFDHELMISLAQKQKDWQFVFIGDANEEKRQSLSAPNIHFLGSIQHDILGNYAQYFHVCMIPFKVNQLTNSVSPVKLFEYASLGKPMVASALEEINQYENEWIYLAKDKDDFEHGIKKCLEQRIRKKASIEGPQFANHNTWTHRIELVEKAMREHPRGLLSYANINNTGTVAVMAATFFDLDGKNFYAGGAERYLYDLFSLFQKLGLRMLVYQYGNSQWVRRYKDMDVISLFDESLENTMRGFEKFNNQFYFTTKFTTQMNIYSAFFEAYPKTSGLSIGISHGVAWDGPDGSLDYENKFWEKNQRFIDSFRLCDTIVSVDTNTTNWYQTIDYDIASKMKVIPNYVDIDEFTPREQYEMPREKTIILYPRRLYSPRGFYLMLEVIDEILDQYPNVEFHFVGRGFEEDTKKLEQKIRQRGEGIKWYTLPLCDMQKAYKEADIVVIPTLYSEGTSFSCLEAMASANAIISTRIGGLTDLIINEYNGISIDPTPEALKDAIMDLLDNPFKLNTLKENALKVSKVFTKSKWEERWARLIKSKIDVKKDSSSVPSKLVEIHLQSKRLLQEHFIKKLISDFICLNYFVYIIITNQEESLPESYGRLQFLYSDEEVLAHADYVFSY